MAEASRSVRRTKDGRKIVTRTNRKGQTVSKTMSAKGKDGKRTVASKSRSTTTKSGATIKKRTTASGKTITSRTNLEGKTRKITKDAEGKTQKISRTKKNGTTATQGRRSAAVRSANKTNRASSENKGQAGRIKRLQERKAARKVDGKGTKGIQKRIGAAKKSQRSKIQNRINNKAS